MGKGKKQQSGEQMDLIDVQPENAKAIIAEAKRYKVAQSARLKAGQAEAASKEKVLALIKKADLQRLKDGTIHFKCDGFDITVTPRDELVTVKEANESKTG
jgi:hypothetical protein